MDLNALSQKFKQGEGTNFAAIRLPGTDGIFFFYGDTTPSLKRTELTARSAPAFVCSPYSAGELAYIFEPDAVFRNEELISGAFPSTGKNAADEAARSANFYADESFYTNYVAASVKEITEGRLHKTVAARCRNIELDPSFEASLLFNDLLGTYPGACVYYFSIASLGTWLGASPEPLLTVHNEILRTSALAGTIENGNEQEWSQKERDEHAVTEKFIEGIFKRRKMAGYKKTGVEELSAGPVKHLVSSFSWKPGKGVLEKSFHKILEELNPTPAVCGMPRSEASSFIALNEKMERRFYSGFIGILNGASATDLYVNLRCMEITGSKAHLYAGAGITKDSVGAREWQETERKMDTLGKLL